MARPPKEYAIYRGNQLIDVGTVKEMAQRLHLCTDSLYKTLNRKYKYPERFFKLYRIEG